MYIDTTKRINLVSLKNIDIWPMGKKVSKIPIIPYKGIHFLTNWTKFFYGNSEDFYLSISVNKSWFRPYLPFSIFGP